MNRRNFLIGLGTLIGGIALDQAVPLGRVYSFPKVIKCLNVEAPRIYEVSGSRLIRTVIDPTLNIVGWNIYLPANDCSYSTFSVGRENCY